MTVKAVSVRTIICNIKYFICISSIQPFSIIWIQILIILVLTTRDKHYLCCQRVARLEVSLAREVAERSVKVSCDQSLPSETWFPKYPLLVQSKYSKRQCVQPSTPTQNNKRKNLYSNLEIGLDSFCLSFGMTKIFRVANFKDKSNLEINHVVATDS